jgi:hypothetical protein
MILASEMVASNNVMMFFRDNARKIGYKSTYAINPILKGQYIPPVWYLIDVLFGSI